MSAAPRTVTFALAGWFKRNDGPITVDHIVNVFTTALKRHHPAHQIQVVKTPNTSTVYDVLLCSVFQPGDKSKPLRDYKAKVKIMFSAENALRFKLQHVAPHCDYFVGFTGGMPSLPQCHLVPFPNWMYYWDFMADTGSSSALEHVRMHQPLATEFASRKKKACFIAMNPNGGQREAMVRALQALGRVVDCPGKVCNNMPSVEQQTGIEQGRKAKQVFLTQYALNLCPENSQCAGYMTEKIMQASMADCIPIYFGERNLVPGILNPERILFCTGLTQIGKPAGDRLRALFADEKAFEQFYLQPVFLPTAAGHIEAFRQGFWDMMRDVGARLQLTTTNTQAV